MCKEGSLVEEKRVSITLIENIGKAINEGSGNNDLINISKSNF